MRACLCSCVCTDTEDLNNSFFRSIRIFHSEVRLLYYISSFLLFLVFGCACVCVCVNVCVCVCVRAAALRIVSPNIYIHYICC